MPYGGTPDHIPERVSDKMNFALKLFHAVRGLHPSPVQMTHDMNEIVAETYSTSDTSDDYANYEGTS